MRSTKPLLVLRARANNCTPVQLKTLAHIISQPKPSSSLFQSGPPSPPLPPNQRCSLRRRPTAARTTHNQPRASPEATPNPCPSILSRTTISSALFSAPQPSHLPATTISSGHLLTRSAPPLTPPSPPATPPLLRPQHHPTPPTTAHINTSPPTLSSSCLSPQPPSILSAAPPLHLLHLPNNSLRPLPPPSHPPPFQAAPPAPPSPPATPPLLRPQHHPTPPTTAPINPQIPLPSSPLHLSPNLLAAPIIWIFFTKNLVEYTN